MYSNADSFIGPIECIMCNATIRPVSQPGKGTKSKFSDSTHEYYFNLRSQWDSKRTEGGKYNLYVWSWLVHIQYTPEGLVRHSISVWIDFLININD